MSGGVEDNAGGREVSNESEELQVGQPWLISQSCPREVADMPREGADGGTGVELPFSCIMSAGAPSPPTPQPLCFHLLEARPGKREAEGKKAPGWVP